MRLSHVGHSRAGEMVRRVHVCCVSARAKGDQYAPITPIPQDAFYTL